MVIRVKEKNNDIRVSGNYGRFKEKEVREEFQVEYQGI